MRFHHRVIMLLLVLGAGQSLADNGCGSEVGDITMGKVSLTCQNITGNAALTDTTIKGRLTVMGGLVATHATLDSIEVTGNVSLNISTVKGATLITGQLMATGSTLKDIEIYGDDVTLDNTTTGNILIVSGRANTKPALHLSNNSTVNGNITFSQNSGIVDMNGSKLTGKIIGGVAK